jgi:hypothetical protein
MSAHTWFRKGQRVILTLRDGTRIIDHYDERESSFVRLRRHGRIKRCTIRAMTVYRGQKAL